MIISKGGRGKKALVRRHHGEAIATAKNYVDVGDVNSHRLKERLKVNCCEGIKVLSV